MAGGAMDGGAMDAPVWTPEGWNFLPSEVVASAFGDPGQDGSGANIYREGITVAVRRIAPEGVPRLFVGVFQRFGPYPAMTYLRWSPETGLVDPNDGMWMLLYGEHVDDVEAFCRWFWYSKLL
jgi:hypothetical protein